MQAINDNEFLGTFRRHRDLCAALLDCSRQQMELIAGDNYTELLEVIARKQRLIDDWEQLKAKQPRLADAWNSRRGNLDPRTRTDCEGLIKEIQTLYETLLEEEQESTAALSLRRDATKRQLQSISQGAQTHHAYRDHLAPATHRHLDIGK